MRLLIKFTSLLTVATLVHLSLLGGRFAVIGMLTGEDQAFVRAIIGQMDQNQVSQYREVGDDPHTMCSAVGHAAEFCTDSTSESSRTMRPQRIAVAVSATSWLQRGKSSSSRPAGVMRFLR